MIAHVDNIEKFNLAQYIVKVNEFCEHFIIHYNRTIELLLITQQFLLPFELILWEKTKLYIYIFKNDIVPHTTEKQVTRITLPE